MSKLLSCFGQRKNKRGKCSYQDAMRGRRKSKDNNQLVYIVNTGNQHGFSGNVCRVYRPETESKTPQYKTFTSRQSTSHPNSPEPFEMQSKRKNSVERKSFMASAAKCAIKLPEGSGFSLPYGIPMEDPNNCSQRISHMGGPNFSDNISTESRIGDWEHERSPISQIYALANSVQPMVYVVQDVDNSPMTANKHVRQMPVKTKIKQPHNVTTSHGKTKKPLEPVRRYSTSTGKRNSLVKVMDFKTQGVDKDFPLAQIKEEPTVYIVQDAYRSPMSVNTHDTFSHVCPMPVKTKIKQPYVPAHNVTTSGGKIPKPLKAVRGCSASSGKMNSSLKVRDLKSQGVSQDFPLAQNEEEPMVYVVQDAYRSPMSVNTHDTFSHVRQMPVKTKIKQPHNVTISGGKTAKPLKAVGGCSSSGNRNSPLKGLNLKSQGVDKDFPLAQSESKTRNSTCERSQISQIYALANATQPMVYVVEDVDNSPMSAGGRRRSHDEDAMSSSAPSDGAKLSIGDNLGGNGLGPSPPPGGSSKRKRSCLQVNQTQIPETQPATSLNQGENMLVNAKTPNTPGTNINRQFCDGKEDRIESNMNPKSKESFVKLISSTQYSVNGKETDYICVSPERFFTMTDGSQLKWRVVIRKDGEK